jgi:hypothetical protein
MGRELSNWFGFEHKARRGGIQSRDERPFPHLKR